MRMPFEKLMEHIEALSESDWNLPMGVLGDRWGEPSSRVSDAITAVRVKRGERTYVTVEPEPKPPCRGFQWIGQPFSSCDGCGKPAWEHEGEMRLRRDALPFGNDDPWELRPWKPGEAEAIKRKWGRAPTA